MKERYIEFIDKAFSAYTDERIKEYLDRVESEGVTEHGFARLASNLGFLIAHGRRLDKRALFERMMDICCAKMPTAKKAGNEFTVREVMFCLFELEEAAAYPQERITAWREAFRGLDPELAYSTLAYTPEDVRHNWTLFLALGEYARGKFGLDASDELIDIQLATQMRLIDENGMYLDPGNPMVYDLVPRALFSFLIYMGYRGRFYEQIDSALRRAALISLRMQSTTGELPYGGRSNQFMHNEAWLSIIFEFEARRYKKEENAVLAARFKAAANAALTDIDYWFSKNPIRHIKNRYPTELGIGCEGYAYFDKYMITSASLLYLAYLLADDEIEPSDAKLPNEVFSLPEHFHKTFLRAGDWFLELDTAADMHYDCSGLGRVHKKGAPSAICLSVPCPAHSNYKLELEDAALASLAVGVVKDGKPYFATGEDAKYTLTSSESGEDFASCSFDVALDGCERISSSYKVCDGVDIIVRGDGEVSFMLPAFEFDGEQYAEITVSENQLCVRYNGYICRYTSDAQIYDSGESACNRNGRYRVFYTKAKNRLDININIEKEA